MPEPTVHIKNLLKDLAPGLSVFRLDSIRDDMLAAKDAFAEHLVPGSQQHLETITNQLSMIASAKEGDVIWGTPLDRPLRTLASNGSHQPGREGHGRSLYATVGFTWTMRLLGVANGKTPFHRWFALANSSVSVRLFDEKENDLLVARWDFDVGNNASPGCHFHSKAHPLSELGGSAVDVPRLPGLLFMPSDALDFVCGELWQDGWPAVVAANTPQMRRWRPLALDRMRTLLLWYAEVAKDSNLSGWMCIKKAKPGPLNLLGVS